MTVGSGHVLADAAAQQFSLDDLLGYSKLQEILGFLLQANLRHGQALDNVKATIDSGPESLKHLQDALALMDQRLSERCAMLEERASAAEHNIAEGGTGQATEKASEALEANFKKLSGALRALQADAVRWNEVDELIQHTNDLTQNVDRLSRTTSEGFSELEARLLSVETALNEPVEKKPRGAAEEELMYLQKGLACLEDRLAPKMDELRLKMLETDKVVQGFADQLEHFEKAPDHEARALILEMDARQIASDELLSKNTGDIDTLRSELGRIGREITEVTQNVLSAQLQECFAGLQELRNALADSSAKLAEEKTAELAELVRRVQDGLATVMSAVEGEVKPGLSNIIDKEAADVQALMTENSALKLSLAQLVAKAASGTTRCLSCGLGSSMGNDAMMVGSDGRMYKRRPNSATKLSRPGMEQQQQDQWSSAVSRFGANHQAALKSIKSKTHAHGGAGAAFRRFRLDDRRDGTGLAPASGWAKQMHRPKSTASLDSFQGLTGNSVGF
eukprot:TRINITY_DN18931_c0_g1_i1.p1 TRINITY_DN18931_c0_g1~~TRINITY_DN18931_c0_g1_i1.p1  ORF type:complete len:507 (+),score=124.58 TRINITY_DN18931_c0_g1_i1:93-1613(+)